LLINVREVIIYRGCFKDGNSTWKKIKDLFLGEKIKWSIT